jgi:hypothetical protein
MPRMKLEPGRSRTVCLAFQVPARSRAEAFRYRADGGDGDTGFRTLAA